MSLREAYHLAHSAECRLKIEASRPDRNLRFLVGHLLHYENLRLRIVEIEHDVTQSAHANAIRIQGANDNLQGKSSTGQLGRRSPPPPPVASNESYDDDEEDDDEDDEDQWIDGGSDEDEDEGLGLQRFPSASAQPPRPSAPEVGVDVETRDPLQPDEATLQKALQQGDGSSNFKTLYESVRKCSCHNQTDAPSFERVWDLPPDAAGRQGVTIAVAEVSG